MAVTITTADLVGLLGDTIPFAHGDDDLPYLNAINVVWDGDKLHAQATDMYRIAWSSWHQDDEPERDYQTDLLAPVGSDDDPWQVLVPLDDAQHLVKTFKLPPKESYAVVTLDVDVHRLTVKRARETGHCQIRVDIDGVQTAEGVGFPDLAALLSKFDVVSKVDGIAFNPKLLADFGKVRPRGNAMSLRFTGEDSAVLVTIGERFCGSIMPVREGVTA